MVYPTSPFPHTFNLQLLFSIQTDYCSTTLFQQQQQQNVRQHQILMAAISKWLCTSPKMMSFRINTLQYTVKEALERLQFVFMKMYPTCFQQFSIDIHPELNDTIIIRNWPEKDIKIVSNKQIIIDTDCAAAILRGAHIYASGIIGMSQGTKRRDTVSVYGDLKGQCLKGQSENFPNQEDLIFLGNGTVQMDRQEIFNHENLPPKGVGIAMFETISNCPILNETIFPRPGSALLQNLPSIICGHILNPQKGENVLDMCAAPGHKTTHLAALMQNQGVIIAVDRTTKRIEELTENCKKYGCKIVQIVHSDSTKLEFEEKFDKILLDVPCSCLGRRPQFSNNKINEKLLNSYVPQQRKLFEKAVDLLKIGGALVYSTCTITMGENEGIVSWALNKFPNLKLVQPHIKLGGPGLNCTNLNEDECKYLQRFGPEEEHFSDSSGFFIAKFTKNPICM